MKTAKWVRVLLTAAAIAGVVVATVRPAAAQRDKNAPQTRTLTGTVMKNGDVPVPKAIVYIKNTKTLAIKTFITDETGNYRFHGLSPNIDYEVFAEYNDKRSDTKTLSSFDSRAQAKLNLKIDVD